MNIEEFSARTNMYPDDTFFKCICNEYATHNEWDKDEFCRAYLENRDGIAEKIQQAANEARSEQKGEIQVLLAQIKELNDQIEVSKEWKPVSSNYLDYDDKKKKGALKDTEAKNIITQYVHDIHPDSISIIRNKGVWEKNRFGELRRTDEKIDMTPWGFFETEYFSKSYTASIAFRIGNEEYILNVEDGTVRLEPIFKISNSFDHIIML